MIYDKYIMSMSGVYENEFKHTQNIKAIKNMKCFFFLFSDREKMTTLDDKSAPVVWTVMTSIFECCTYLLTVLQYYIVYPTYIVSIYLLTIHGEKRFW